MACRTLISAGGSVDPAPAGDDRGVPVRDDGVLPAGVRQEFSGSGAAQQAVLGAGVQHVYLGDRAPGPEPEPAVSIAAPAGQRDESLPLRGRDALLAELADTGPRVRVVHGLGGCGKTRLALEAAFEAHTRWPLGRGDSRAGRPRRSRSRVPGRPRRPAAGTRPRPPIHADNLPVD